MGTQLIKERMFCSLLCGHTDFIRHKCVCSSRCSWGQPKRLMRCYNRWMQWDEELLMESEVSRRILADGKITYKGFKPEKPFCNAQLYSNCIEAINMKTRPCAMDNRCQRGNEWSWGMRRQRPKYLIFSVY